MSRFAVGSGPGPLAYGLIAGIVALGFATGLLTVVAVNHAAGRAELTGSIGRAAAKEDRAPLHVPRGEPVAAALD